MKEDCINQFQVDFEFQDLSKYLMKDDASSPKSTPIKKDNQFVQYNQTGSTIHLRLVDLSGGENVIFIIDPTNS